jgi:oxysterol-binding protein-related protein 9/10/11
MLKSIATIRGDLSNITAPPFVLDTKSAVELPSFWAERPSVFVAPAGFDDPARRALSVLRWFLSSLRNQQYAGHEPEEGVKKPLNAFLGEVFLARWDDDAGTTQLVSEQVSHHPPVTACRVWNDKHGVYAEGFTRQEITFSGNVNIKQIGHACLHVSKHDETYLIPLPNVKVKGILTGTPYPEISDKYYIPSTNGFISSIDFTEKGFFGSSDKKHSFEAKLYKEGDEDHPLFTVNGNWDSEFTIHDVHEGKDIETFNIVAAESTQLTTEPLEDQDPWESRAAWKGVREALEKGDMQGTSDAKNSLENGQREMRKQEGGDDGDSWSRIFFSDMGEDTVATSLASKIGQKIIPQDTCGIWKFNLDAWEKGISKPYHGDLRPDNTKANNPSAQQLNGVKGAASESTQTTNSGEQKPGSVPDSEEEKQPAPQDLENHSQPKDGTEDVEKGVGGMSLKEQTAVEDLLRSRYSSQS